MIALEWALVIAGPFVCGFMGAVVCHFVERRHWHQLVQQWYDDGRAMGWDLHAQHCLATAPELAADPPTLLDPALEGFQPWLGMDEAFSRAFAAIAEQTDAARAQLSAK